MTGTDATGALSVLGVSPAEETAYALLIDAPGATIDELSERWPRREPLTEVLAGLCSAGLVRASADRPPRYHAVPPRAAFSAPLADGWRELHDLREQAERLARDRPGTEVVEVVTGAAAVRDRLLSTARGARRQLRRMTGPQPVDPAMPDVERELLDREVACRALRRDPDPGRIEAGVQVRDCAAVPVTMVLIDDRVAVLPVDADRFGTTAALMVHPSELLVMLDLLFEHLWERAGTPQRPAGPEPEQLVGLLLSGLTDDAISRALGVSQRTVQRRIAAMMTAAGARTRFQAGVQAALRRGHHTEPGDPAQ